MAWWKITFGNLKKREKEILIDNLTKYCKLDTMEMVELTRKLNSIAMSNT